MSSPDNMDIDEPIQEFSPSAYSEHNINYQQYDQPLPILVEDASSAQQDAHPESLNLRIPHRWRDHDQPSCGSSHATLDVKYDIEADDEHVTEDDGSNLGSLGEHSAALRSYFLSRLEEAVLLCGGISHANQLQGWKVEVFKRNGGLAMGIIDVFYFSPNSKKYRSRVEAVIGLGISQNIRTLKAMSKQQLHEISLETREKLLIGQQLSLYSYKGTCSSIALVDGAISLIFNDESPLSGGNIISQDTLISCFAIGNITILSWGNITLDPSFHTATQIYPLGFKCIRQEHDVLYDRVVDCLCEIDAITENDSISPLFRISIAWVTDSASPCVRVYEAKSPQLAWQAAMLESLGLEYPAPAYPEDLNAISPSDASMDVEESRLRSEIRETRRDYFRALRNEQSLGMQGAVKPRLSVDSVDGFGDEIILRMLEGMPGADLLTSYAFLDSRVKDGGRKHVLRCLARTQSISKQLEKVVKKNLNKELLLSREKERDAVATELKKAEPKKRERVDTVEKEKKKMRLQEVRESKEERVQRLMMIAQHRQRLRDLDKQIRGMREGLLKDVKRRRVEAGLRLEGLCDVDVNGGRVRMARNIKSSSSSSASMSREARPLASHRPLPFTGDSFGEMLELWGFLVTFSDSLGIQMVPSIQRLEEALRYMDPLMRKLCNAAACFSHTLDNAILRNTGDYLYEGASSIVKESRVLLDKIGVVLCRALLPEFMRLIGMEVDIQAEASKFMLNSLTWMEIARVVLLGSISKDVGMSEADIASVFKGKGYTMIPDANDRKVLRLCRKRILNGFKYRKENQEAIVGFSHGFCIRIPYAYSDSECPDFSWVKLIHLLENTPSTCSWKIFEIAHVAFIACGALEAPYKSRAKTSIKSAISPNVFHHLNAAATKAALLAELRALSVEQETAELDQVLRLNGNSVTPKCITLVDSEISSSTTLNVVISPDGSAALNAVRLRLSGSKNTMHLARPLFSSAEALRFVARLETHERYRAEQDEAYEDQDERKTPAEDIASSLHSLAVGMDLDPEKELALLEQLSAATQRCYEVVRDIMVHPQAVPMSFLVDVTTSPDYYKKVKHPLFFSDIRRALVMGGYEASGFPLTNFYLDMSLVLENALTYHSEVSVNGQAALKVASVFERLFLEVVLSWDNPLARNDCCNVCRFDDTENHSRITICDRCEASYHSCCLDDSINKHPDLGGRRNKVLPNISRIKALDAWFCPGCIEQYSVASTHHFKMSRVTHPSTRSEGEVVGIEQVNMEICFIVSFKDGTKERWSCSRVKENRFYPKCTDSAFCKNDTTSTAGAGENVASPAEIQESTCAETNHVHADDPIPEDKSTSELIFPSGFYEEDINLVSGFCRGYHAWGSLQFPVPAHVDPDHSIPASVQEAKNSQFLRWRKAVALLGPLSDPDELSSSDWLHVLVALSRKNLSSGSSLIASALASLDIETVHANSQINDISLNKIAVKSNVIIGDDLREVNLCTPLPQKALDVEEEDDSELSGRLTPNELLEFSDKETASLSGEGDDSVVSDLFSETSANRAEEVEDGVKEDLFDEDFDASDDVHSGVVDVIRESSASKRVDDELRWEACRASRNKAREDALLTRALVCEVMMAVDLTEVAIIEGQGNCDEPTPQSSLVNDSPADRTRTSIAAQRPEPPLNSVYLTSVKACMPRTVDAPDQEEYLRVWEAKLVSLSKLNASQMLCQYCGFSETQLCSHFVCGFSYPEWLSHEQQSGPEDRNQSSPWLPYCVEDAAVELGADESGKRMFRQGSLAVHECCADLMDGFRRAAARRASWKDDDAAADVLTGLRRGRRSPIGVDSEGSVYWVFPGSNCLYVSDADSARTHGFSPDGSILNDAPISGAIVDTDYGSRTELLSNRWSVYSEPEDIAALVLWLKDDLPNESMLRALLLTLFPSSSVVIGKSSSTMISGAEDALSDETFIPSVSVLSGIRCSSSELPSTPGNTMRDGSSIAQAAFLGDDGREESDGETEDNSEDDDDEMLVRATRSQNVKSSVTHDTAFVSSHRFGDQVLVRSLRGDLLRDARVQGVHRVGEDCFYNLRYAGTRRSSPVDNWYHEEALLLKTPETLLLQKSSWDKYIKATVLWAPNILRSLHAIRFTRLSDRAGAGQGMCRGTITYSDTQSTLGILKAALLTVEAALPLGSIDNSDDKWCDAFDEPWRNAVVSADSASALMECELSLESAIKNAWLKPAGSKVLCALPSRAISAKQSTYGLVALRLWTLDQAVRYEKVLLPTTGDRPASKNKKQKVKD